MRSKIPPCPGIAAPMSLVPMSRLIRLTERSPSIPPTPTIKPVRISCVAPKNGNENRSNQGKTMETPSAPSAPSHVLFGLISLRSGCRPNNDWDAPRENDQQPNRRHHQPRAIGLPDRAQLLP